MNYDVKYKNMENAVNDFYGVSEAIDGYAQRLERVRSTLGLFTSLAGYKSSVGSRATAVRSLATAAVKTGQCVDNARMEYLLAEQTAYVLISGDSSFKVGDGVTAVTVPVHNGGEGNKAWWQTDFLKEAIGIFGKLTKNDTIGGIMAIIGYSGALKDFCGGEKSGPGAVANWLKLVKASVGVEDGLYKFLQTVSKAENAVKLTEAFGKTFAWLNVIGNGAGTTADFIKLMTNIESGWLGVAQWLDFGKSGAKLGNAINKLVNFAPKILNPAGKAVSQTGGKAVLAKSISTYFTIATAGLATVSTAIKKYEKYSDDGVYDWNDIAATGMEASLSGLNELFLFGILSEDTLDNVSSGIQGFAADWGSAAYRKIESDYVLKHLREKGGMYNFIATWRGIGAVAEDWMAGVGKSAVKTTGDAWGNVTSGIKGLLSW